MVKAHKSARDMMRRANQGSNRYGLGLRKSRKEDGERSLLSREIGGYCHKKDGDRSLLFRESGGFCGCKENGDRSLLSREIGAGFCRKEDLDRLIVICNSKEADYLPKRHLIMCDCSECGQGTTMSITAWEKHVGCKMKKWKKSVRVKASSQLLKDWIEQEYKAGVRDLGFYSSQWREPPRFGEKELTPYLQRPRIMVKIQKRTGDMMIRRPADQGENQYELGLGLGSRKEDGDRVIVTCNLKEADYIPKSHLIMCKCTECGKGTTMSLSIWEKHVGCKMKKWKCSVRVKASGQLLKDWIEQEYKAGVRDLGFYSIAPSRFGEKELTSCLQQPYTPIEAKWTYERCAVCRGLEDCDDNKFIICNSCQVTVHQNCYGAREVQNFGSWTCRACETPDIKRECCLCPVIGGALKPSSTGQFWVHVTCAWCSDAVIFPNDKTMEPADGILKIDPESFRKTCIICNEMHGYCIKCFLCQTFYHPMCAFIAGFSIRLNIGANGKIVTISYCASHRTPSREATLTLSQGDPNRSAAPIITAHQQYSNSTKAECKSALVQAQPAQIEPPAARCRVYNRQNKENSALRASGDGIGGYCCHRAEVIEALNGINQEAAPQQFSSTKERLVYTQKTEKKRLYVGKSGIHEWGLFARRCIREGDMVIEYRGEVVRGIIADIREIRAYLPHKDSYLFKISDEIVVDATQKGSMARFINHSCAPNCYARILAESRIAIMANKDIAARQEITLDYMFPSGESKVPCLCGLATCRRFLNILPSDAAD